MDVTGGMLLPDEQHGSRLEQQQQLLHTSVPAGDRHPPGCGPVDLASGKVVVALDQEAVLPQRPRTEHTEDADGTGDTEGAEL